MRRDPAFAGPVFLPKRPDKSKDDVIAPAQPAEVVTEVCGQCRMGRKGGIGAIYWGS
jgi:hypothetical protein